jgi:hypothetical protein
VLFGLYCPADGRFRGEPEAAAECHRQIVAAGRKGQHDLRPEVPSYDPQTGFKGLLEWAERVRWNRRRRSPWWLLLLLLPLLFLPLCCYWPPERVYFLETEIETDSMILIVDKSKSMTPCFPHIQKEAKRFLTSFRKRNKHAYFDVIFYDAEAKSVLGGIEELDDKKVDFIDNELTP